MFYTLMDDFSICLLYQDGDELLTQYLFEIYLYMKNYRLARFALEYSISGSEESEEFYGLIPVKRLKTINKALFGLTPSTHPISYFQKIENKFHYLESVRLDYQKQVNNADNLHLSSFKIRSKTNSSWSSLIDSINVEVKDNQDENKAGDTNRTKLKSLEAYFLTTNPMERINFDVTNDLDMEDTIVPVIEEEIPKTTPDDIKDDIEKENEKEKEKDLQDETTLKQTTIQRSSKRLARDSVSVDSPEVIVNVQHFAETKAFFDNLNLYFQKMRISRLKDVTHIYVETDGLRGYISDFVLSLNEWSKEYTSAFLADDSPKGTDDDKLKLLDVLGTFGGLIMEKSSTNVSQIDEFKGCDNARTFILKSNQDDWHYMDLKVSILKQLLTYITDAYYGDHLFIRLREWILQVDSYILENNNIDLQFGVGIFEVLVDYLISLKNQIISTINQNQKRSTKSSINAISLELVKVMDKLNRWKTHIDHLLETETNGDDSLSLICRFKWSIILKENALTSSLDDSNYVLGELQDLKSLIEQSDSLLSVSFPNFDSIPLLNLNNVTSLITNVIVLTTFSKLLYSNSDSSATISVLEEILINRPGNKRVGSISLIRRFLDDSPIDMKLKLWKILFSYYNNHDKLENFQFGFEKILEFMFKFLLSSDYESIESIEERTATLFRMLGFYNEILMSFLTSLSKNSWKLPIARKNKQALERLSKLFEMIYSFSLHEEASIISTLKISIKTRSTNTYQKLKDLLVRSASILVLYMRNYDTKLNTRNLISTIHDQIGIRGLCDSSEGLFLKMAQDLLTSLSDCETELSQLIFCRYHYNVGHMSSKDHHTASKEDLDANSTKELAKFVLPLCFTRNPLVQVPKHELKALVDEFYSVIGDPDFDSCETLHRNFASLDHFLDSTRITQRFVRDAFYGLINLGVSEPRIDSKKIIQDGLYYLEGLFIFSSYKVRKKNMQSRIVELENVIMLLKNDLIYGTDRIGSWFLLGQAFGFLVEDDLIWTSDKLTVADRKIGTSNLQRKSLICYLMAINASNKESEQSIKPILGSLMSSFGKELYSACMEPMAMHAFKVQVNSKFIRKPSGAAFINVDKESSIPMRLCLKIMQQCFQLSIKAKGDDWTNYYYLAKIQRKLKKDPSVVLRNIQMACILAEEYSSSSEHIIEPHYIICSFIYKYVKSDELSVEESLKFLQENPVIMLSSDVSATSKIEFYSVIIDALRKVDSYDKKNWHHKPNYRIAKILFEEFDKVEDAVEEMSSIISLKATSKTLVSIWKPEQERPGKHFYYTYQYSSLYITLLANKSDLISLISMLPKLRRSNSTMVSLYTTWESLCSSICKIIRASLDIGESFAFTENFLQVPYQTFMLNAKSLLDLIEANGLPTKLEPHVCFLHAINDMKKFNNGFGPTSLIDDTIVGIFNRIYLYYHKDLDIGQASQVTNTTESPGGKIKKLAKRDIFPFANDLLKNLRREIETILKDKPNIYNDFVHSVLTKKPEEQKSTNSESAKVTESEDLMPNRKRQKINGQPSTIYEILDSDSDDNTKHGEETPMGNID
ncbi:hypothetical protein DFJ63DRAFT_290729 [Scheffersomyces coipomensis]|uniref:uncharacterized protein n=1 Tax=Scheffersomyces coipomensis TaxID=1788519 RepID=UPI00315C535A